MSVVSSLQIKMARAALRWSVDYMAEVTNLSRSTLKRVETNDGFAKATKANVRLIIQTLEAAGIEFVGTPDDGPGVRLWRSAPAT